MNEATYRLSVVDKKKAIDLIAKNGVVDLGIYLLEEDRLTICTAISASQPRPSEFATRPNSGHMLVKLKRDKQ